MGWIPSFFSGYNGKTIRNVGRTITAASGAYSLGSRIYKSWYKHPRRTFPRGDPRAYQSINKQLLGQRVFTRRRIRRGGFYGRRRYLRRYYGYSERGRRRAQWSQFHGEEDKYYGKRKWKHIRGTWHKPVWIPQHDENGRHIPGAFKKGTWSWKTSIHAKQSRAADTWNHRRHY